MQAFFKRPQRLHSDPGSVRQILLTERFQPPEPLDNFPHIRSHATNEVTNFVEVSHYFNFGSRILGLIFRAIAVDGV